MCPYCTVKSFNIHHKQDFKNHVEECMRVEVECPNSCGEKRILRKNVLMHTQIHCKESPMDCPHTDCNMTLPFKDWALHMKECKFKKILCKVKCGLELS